MHQRAVMCPRPSMRGKHTKRQTRKFGRTSRMALWVRVEVPRLQSQVTSWYGVGVVVTPIIKPEVLETFRNNGTAV